MTDLLGDICMYTHMCMSICIHTSVCVWPNILLCRKAFKQLFCSPTSLLARIYSGLGSMKYLQAPKRPTHSHTYVHLRSQKNTHSVTCLEVKSTTTAELSTGTKKKEAAETFVIEAEAKRFGLCLYQWGIFPTTDILPHDGIPNR